MKRYLLIALLGIGAASCNSNTPEAPKGQLPTSLVNNPHTANGIDTVSAARKPTMDFKDTVHEFGTIHQGESVTHEFTFTNNGKTPLLITNASGSCGCTVPVYPHDPVAPGKTEVIKVTFNSAGKGGHQEKSVTITTNTVRSIHMLYIKGEVEVPKNK
ncbi:DUF1573 domain-containing protein [Flavipsychrobacter stenotrophus]|nr:DUF1573 domain-containing protein [Flavipsychrobacter stenotrophus]